MKYILFILLSCALFAQNNGIRSLNGSLNNSQRLAVDTTSSATFRWGLSNGVHTLYLPYRIVNPSGSTFKWNVSGQTAKYDSLRLIAGANVSLTQSGNTVTIATSGGGSVGNADSLGGLPASYYLLKSDTAKIYAGYGLLKDSSNHTVTLRADTSILVNKAGTQVISSSKYFTAPQYFRDSVFIGTQPSLSNELFNVSSNTDADIKAWTASASDNSSACNGRCRKQPNPVSIACYSTSV